MRQICVRALTSVTLMAAGTAVAAPVLKAGAWQTMLEGDAERVCYHATVTMDRAQVTSTTARTSSGQCTVSNFQDAGSTVNYDSFCNVPSVGQITTHSVVVQSGPDDFTSDSHSHYATGKRPDIDMKKSYHFAGPCAPDDLQAPF